MSASAVWKLKESGTLHQDFEGEVVLIDLDTGNYFNLPGAAGVLWGRVAAGAVSAALLADELVAQYDVEHAVALADATAFLADLEREGLIEEGAGAAIAPGSTPAKARATYVAPRLEVFRELQDLLLLDPIHEVNPAVGWPQSAGVLQGEAGAIIRLSGDDVLAASVDTTTVVVNRDRGLYCRLDGDAARAWHAMGAGPIFLRGEAVVRPLLEGGFAERAGEDQIPTAALEAAGDVAIHDELHEQIRPWGNRRRLPRSSTTPTAAAICDRLDEWYAASSPTATTTQHPVAGDQITVTAPSGSDTAALVAALPPAVATMSGEPALRVKVWRGLPTAATPFVANLVESLKANWNTLCGPRGEVLDLHTDTTTAVFDPGGMVLSVIDRTRGRAWAVKVDDRPYPFWEVGAPLRFIFHDHFSRRGLQLLHGAAVGNDSGAVLIVGRGGSGKSSTALAAAAHGLSYLGDDYCLVDSAGLNVHALYATGKLVGMTDLERLPLFRGQSINSDSFEHGGSGKGVFVVDAVCRGSLTTSRRLQAIVLPRIDSGPGARVQTASRGDALAAILPSTVGQLPDAGTRDAHHVERLVSSLPVFGLQVGSDPASIATAISDVLRTCSVSA